MVSSAINVSLKAFNSFGLDVYALFFAAPRSVEELAGILDTYDIATNRFLVIGEGSNLLFTANFSGLILHPDIRGIEVLEQHDDYVMASAGAGENWDDFVGYCVDRDWYGLENLSWIPGSVGSAPVQNIGAYGVELKDRMEYLEAYDTREKIAVRLHAADCEFGYRHSLFKGKDAGRYIITRVTFRLPRKPEFQLDYGNVREEFEKKAQKTLKNLRQTIIEIRQSKLPDTGKFGNAGSFFKNPVIGNPVFKCIQVNHQEIPAFPAENNMVKIPAAWLIEKAGWKGRRIGNVGTWPSQPLVIVNYGGASGNEIYDFSEMIREDVDRQFGITLEREVQVF